MQLSRYKLNKKPLSDKELRILIVYNKNKGKKEMKSIGEAEQVFFSLQ
jgi:hypothetical protein